MIDDLPEANHSSGWQNSGTGRQCQDAKQFSYVCHLLVLIQGLHFTQCVLGPVYGSGWSVGLCTYQHRVRKQKCILEQFWCKMTNVKGSRVKALNSSQLCVLRQFLPSLALPTCHQHELIHLRPGVLVQAYNLRILQTRQVDVCEFKARLYCKTVFQK